MLANKVDQKKKRSIADLSDDELKGKNVLVRCDLNVPLDDEQNITDSTRIVKSLPTIQYLIEKGSNVAICSHLGRPKNGPEDKFSLKPVRAKLEELLNSDGATIEVKLAPDCKGDAVKALIQEQQSNTVVLLENTRFYKEETANDPDFVKELGEPFEVYVNDAFGTAHRAHASTEGVTKVITGPSVCGFLMAKELEYLDGAVNSKSDKKLAAIVGGSKVSSKITVLNALVDKCDLVIIGGGMVFTFLKAQGHNVGTSLVEDDYVETAKEILEKVSKIEGKAILLPKDIIVADKFAKDATTETVSFDQIPDGWMGLDNGPITTEEQKEALSDGVGTIIMNGPMGVFEFPKFAKGTMDLINILADLTKEKGVTTVIGGGDSVAATEQSGRAGDMSHISTGGGASLELLEGKELPGVVALDDQ